MSQLATTYEDRLESEYGAIQHHLANLQLVQTAILVENYSKVQKRRDIGNLARKKTVLKHEIQSAISNLAFYLANQNFKDWIKKYEDLLKLTDESIDISKLLKIVSGHTKVEVVPPAAKVEEDTSPKAELRSKSKKKRRKPKKQITEQ